MKKRFIDRDDIEAETIPNIENMAQVLAEMSEELRKGNIPSAKAIALERACIILARDSLQLACSLGLSIRSSG